MFSEEDICRLLRSRPECPEDLPNGLRTILSYDELLTEARQLRREIGVQEWTFSPIDALAALGVKYLIDPGGKSFALPNVIVLQHYPCDPDTVFDAVHEIAHWWFKMHGIRHSEGDAHLLAADLCFFHEHFSHKCAKNMIALCNMMTQAQLISWAERWIGGARLHKVFSQEIMRDPSLASRVRKAVRRHEIATATAVIDHDDPDASWLLPELTGRL